MVIKKGVLISALFLIFFSFLSFVSLANSVYAADVAYILKNDRNAKPEILNVFSELGLSVELIEDSVILTKNLANYKLIFIDDAILRKTKTLPVYNYPSVIMNKNYGEEWGVTDDDGIAQLASNAPLRVRLADDGIVQVYTQAKYNSVSIPYYYLPNENKALGFQKIAGAYAGNGDLGDVVAVAPSGTLLKNGKISQGKICFYGIAKTKFWTSEAEDLFKECVGKVLIECENNNDCNDFNPYTQDLCINPRTPQSTCQHNPIRCLTKNDCGNDGFIGNSFCAGKNVTRNYLSFACNNPRTTGSFCSNLTEARLVSSCEFGCFNGSCIACNSNDDCDDSNLYTEDVCVNPGQINARCENRQIRCFTNLDCGINGYVNSPSCSNEDVFQNYRTFTCNNPETTGSSCSNVDVFQLKQDCGNDYCNNFGANYCKNDDVYHKRTCYDKGCSSGSCFNNPFEDEQLVQECGLAGCVSGSCLAEVHDVALVDFTGSLGGIGFKYKYNETRITGDPVQLFCNQEYRVLIKAKNLGDFYENITYNGSVGGIIFNHEKTNNLAPGNSTSEKVKTVNFSLAPGLYNILINASIIPFIDNNPFDNFASRAIQIICPECFQDLDCENRRIIDNYCLGNNVTSNYSIPSCVLGNCQVSYEQVFNETCEFGCSGGICIECVDNDGDGFAIEGGECGEIDCNDSNPGINPGATEICDQLDNDCDELIDEGNVCRCGPVSARSGTLWWGGRCVRFP